VLPTRPRCLHRADEPPHRRRGLANRRCHWLAEPTQQQPPRHLDAACGQATRRGGASLGGPRAGAAGRYQDAPPPRPPASRNRPFSALLCVERKKGKKRMVQAYISSVSDVLEVRCKFQMDVAKVDQDVACVAMVVHKCCKHLFPMFHLFFQMYVESMFIWMLHMFHKHVASVLSRCCVCLQWF
jgi:hypothetical protein